MPEVQLQRLSTCSLTKEVFTSSQTILHASPFCQPLPCAHPQDTAPLRYATDAVAAQVLAAQTLLSHNNHLMSDLHYSRSQNAGEVTWHSTEL